SATAIDFTTGNAVLEVTDFETLSIIVEDEFIREDEGKKASKLTVTRSNIDDLSLPLDVNLTSSDTTEATVPLSVTIKAGDEFAEADIKAKDDKKLDGEQLVVFIPEAEGYAAFVPGFIIVRDHDAQPDLLYRLHDPDDLNTPYFGDDIYEDSPRKQRITDSIKFDETAAFAIRIQNDGTFPDSFTIKAKGSDKQFEIQYINRLQGGKDITDEIIAGTFTTKLLKPGQGQSFRMFVSPLKEKGKKFKRRRIQARSHTQTDRIDAIRTKIKVTNRPEKTPTLPKEKGKKF
ncbi:MAG: hypothetical protein QF886_25370, partial [Planctomycetota bacterium]|nr:hypothetical protein [Planctomycetota bacterium]